MYFLNRHPLRGFDRQTNPPPPFDMIEPPFRSFLLFSEREREREKEKARERKRKGKNSNEKGSCYRFLVENDISRSKRLTVWQTLNVCGWVEFRVEIPIVETIFQRFSGNQEVDGYENGLAGCPMHLTLHLHPSSWKILQRSSRGHGRFSF